MASWFGPATEGSRPDVFRQPALAAVWIGLVRGPGAFPQPVIARSRVGAASGMHERGGCGVRLFVASGCLHIMSQRLDVE